MPTVIDSLIVEVGLDPKQYTEGRKQVDAEQKALREDARRSGVELEARGKQAAQFFGAIRNQAVALFTTLTAGKGLATFTRDLLKSDAATGRLAKSLGLATSDLGAWQRVAERTGGTAEGITQSLAGLVDQFEQIKLTGTASSAPYLQALGIKREDLEDTQETLLKIADQFAKMDPRRARAFGQALGFDQETISLLQRGRPAVEAMIRAEKERGGVSEESAKATEKLNQQLSDLKHEFDQAGREILLDFLPPATEFLRWLNNAVDKSPELAKGIWAITAAVSALAGITLSRGLLSLLGLGGAAAGGAGAAAGGTGAVGAALGAVGAAARVGGPIGAAAAVLLTPTKANEGEDEIVARRRRAWMEQEQARRKAAGQPLHPDPYAREDAARLGIPLPSWVQQQPAGRGSGPSRAGTNTDVDLAVRTMIKEASAGSDVGLRDVAHVIMNRSQASGKSPGAVVQEKSQFQPWNTARGRAELMAIDPNSAEYRKAVQIWTMAALERRFGVDPTGGATHYFSPKGMVANVRDGLAPSLVPDWARKGQKTMEREGHLFYKGLGYRGIDKYSSRIGLDVQTGAQAAAGANQSGGTTINNTTTVGQVTVNTRATDAKGIARDLGPALRQSNSVATQANSGAQ